MRTQPLACHSPPCRQTTPGPSLRRLLLAGAALLALPALALVGWDATSFGRRSREAETRREVARWLDAMLRELGPLGLQLLLLGSEEAALRARDARRRALMKEQLEVQERQLQQQQRMEGRRERR